MIENKIKRIITYYIKNDLCVNFMNFITKKNKMTKLNYIKYKRK
jgi:hypothetical protein